ncbi:MAG: oxidoreductase, partial [Candidatus Syntropharchaeia archaeon]
RKAAEAIHKHGAKAVLQLNHAGKNVIPEYTGVMPFSPSGLPSGQTRLKTREMTVEEIENIIEMFAEEAERVKKAGFDGVEFMCSTGYLIASFLSSATNKRKDRYGGDAAGRATFLLEIIERTRERVGKNYPISCRLSVIDGMPGGNTIEDSQIQAKLLEEAGVDAFQCWAGWHEAPTPWMSMEVPRGAWVYLAEAIKKVVSVPVMAVGRINNPELAEKILQEGKADLICMGRPLLADPEFVKKTAEGRPEEIRKCIACQRCFESRFREGPIKCSLNPELGREGWYILGKKPVKNPKKVLVVGAGPAGMEAARMAALRGHKVLLYDRKNEIGGQLILAAVPPHKEEIKNIPEYYSVVLERLNVKIELGKEVTPDLVKELNPDAVIVATGATPIIPEIPGIDEENVVTAIDVLEGKVDVGETVVVLGGDLIGAETGEYLAQMGKKVTIVEEGRAVAPDMPAPNRYGFKTRLKNLKVRVLTRTRVESIADHHVLVEKDGKNLVLEADTVVVSMGMKPNDRLFRELQGIIKPQNLYKIGDCLTPAKILEAIHGGSMVGRLV